MSKAGIPPFVDDPSALLLIDFSWWTNAAFHGPGGPSGMMANVVGRLTGLLGHYPAHVAYVRDSRTDTFRDEMRHPTDPAWRYKAARKKNPKPREFYDESDRVAEIFDLHRIPCFQADGWESDDVMATVTRLARAANYRVWLVTSDKDMCALCQEDETSGILVACYNDSTGVARCRREVHRDMGVWPEQVADFLAIAGDSTDGIPGVSGLGEDRTKALLVRFDSIEDALAQPTWTREQSDSVKRDLAKIDAAMKGTKGQEKLSVEAAEEAAWMRRTLMAERDTNKWHEKLCTSREVARFSKALTTLDESVPIDVPWDQLPTGGFDVAALRERYTELRFHRKAAQVPDYPKAEPWGRLP